MFTINTFAANMVRNTSRFVPGIGKSVILKPFGLVVMFPLLLASTHVACGQGSCVCTETLWMLCLHRTFAIWPW